MNMKYLFFSAALVSLVLIGCGDPIPISEMVVAKKSINKAQSVRADKYAAADLEAAKKKLSESHQYVIDEDMEKSQKSAEEARVLADKAYETALPLLASDTIKIAEKSLEEASESAADKLAEKDYQDASTRLKNANDLFQNKKYYEAYNEALEADKLAKNSRNTAISRKSELKNSIEEVRSTLAEGQKYGADKKNPEKYNLAVKSLDDADKSYSNLKLRKGFAEVEVAKVNADELFLSSLGESAKEKSAESATILERAEASEGAQVAVDELDAAKESNENARILLAEGKYRESISASEESVKLSTIVIGTRKPPVQEDPDKNVSGAEGEEGQEVEEVQPADDVKEYWTYTVVYRKDIEEKDCLRFIARKFYKNSMLWPRIYNANRDKIKNPDLIYPGQVLRIPKPGK